MVIQDNTIPRLSFADGCGICQPSSRSPRANSTTPVLSLTLINALILLIYIGNHIFQYTISDDLNTESESRLFAVQ